MVRLRHRLNSQLLTELAEALLYVLARCLEGIANLSPSGSFSPRLPHGVYLGLLNSQNFSVEKRYRLVPRVLVFIHVSTYH